VGVLAILVVATAVVLPSAGTSGETLRLRSEAGRIAAVLREARLHAVSQRRPTRVVADTVRNTVAVTGADPDHPLRRIELPAELRLSVVTGADSLTFSSRGVTRETQWVVEAPGGRRLAIDVD